MQIFSALFMEERFRLCSLIDYYGNLLTDKQKNIMKLYFFDDLSLSEISEITRTSRQAVFDIIKRCTKLLNEYEEHLSILKKEENLSNIKKEILEKLDNLQLSLQGSSNIDMVKEIKKYVNESL